MTFEPAHFCNAITQSSIPDRKTKQMELLEISGNSLMITAILSSFYETVWMPGKSTVNECSFEVE